MCQYLIIEKNKSAIADIQKVLHDFIDFTCIGVTDNYHNSMEKILKETPNLIFFNIDTSIKDPFNFVQELNTFSDDLPTFIAISNSKDRAYEAMKCGFFDLLLNPLSSLEIRKSVLVYQKKTFIQSKRNICLKSYKDYRFLNTDEILFLKADNNSTDFYLENGKVISAFKTLKKFLDILPNNFLRVHKSYILNKNYVSRIQFGKLMCSIKNSNHYVPFTKTYLDIVNLMNDDLSQNIYQSRLN